MRHAGLRPYAALLAALGEVPGQEEALTDTRASARPPSSAPPCWIARADAIARDRGIRSAAGAPIRFEAASAAGAGAQRYEALIHNEGRILCRREGGGAAHDLHNALVWLRFPRLKATLNRWHVAEQRSPEGRGAASRVAQPRAGRGRLRDAITLLDESGLVWIGGDPQLVALLEARRWADLLVGERHARLGAVRAVVIGHGLLEKLHRPYKSMTAHCLPCPAGRSHPDRGDGDGDHGDGDHGDGDHDAAGRDTDAGETDAPDAADPTIAGLIDTLAAAGDLSPARLLPLPVQGLPGWDPANADPSYYADLRVFRPARGATPGR